MVALRLPVPLNKEPRVQMPGGGRSLAPPVLADAVCCLSARRRRRPTLNDLEVVMCDEEELWSPSMHRGWRAAGGWGGGGHESRSGGMGCFLNHHRK